MVNVFSTSALKGFVELFCLPNGIICTEASCLLLEVYMCEREPPAGMTARHLPVKMKVLFLLVV